MDKGAKKDPKYVIGLERHPSPDDAEKCWHFHAHIEFATKFESENPRIFDLNGVHPSIAGRFGPAYAAKDGNYISNREDSFWKPAPRPKVLEPSFPWQLALREQLTSEPDDTTVTWVWEPEGGCGKTSFAKWACVTKELGTAILVGGRSVDIKHAISKMIEAKRTPRVVFVNVPRDGSVSYRALEEVKDGIFFSAKYDSGMCCFDSPHVVVFANFEPDKSRLSKHRWNVINPTED